MNVFGGLSANLTFMSFDATYIMGDKYTMQCNLNLVKCEEIIQTVLLSAKQTYIS